MDARTHSFFLTGKEHLTFLRKLSTLFLGKSPTYQDKVIQMLFLSVYHLASSQLTLPYLTLPYLTLPYLTLPYRTVPSPLPLTSHLFLSHLTSYHLPLPVPPSFSPFLTTRAIPSDSTSSHLISSHPPLIFLLFPSYFPPSNILPPLSSICTSEFTQSPGSIRY